MKCRHATDLDLNTICDLLATEFYNDPVLESAFTDTIREQRLESLRRFFCIYINLARKHGGILIAENDIGVLVYFRPELMEMTEEENIQLNNLLRQESGADFVTVVELMNGLNHSHPQDFPHYYVFAIAVRLSHRHKGVATGLLSELNMILDREMIPCYAECTSPGTKNLFARLGYRDARLPLHIEGFTPIFPVWRDPVV